jgi:hypothetical protein
MLVIVSTVILLVIMLIINNNYDDLEKYTRKLRVDSIDLREKVSKMDKLLSEIDIERVLERVESVSCNESCCGYMDDIILLKENEDNSGKLYWTLKDKDFAMNTNGTPLLYRTRSSARLEKEGNEKVVKVIIKEIK